MGGSTSVDLKWVGGLTFTATNERGVTATIDSPSEDGGPQRSLSPTQMLLSAVGACSGMDVVSILQKTKQDVKGLRIQVSGERTSELPRYYRHIHLKYIVEGRGVEEAALRKAITLSHEKYCTVSLSLSGRVKVDWSFEIIEK